GDARATASDFTAAADAGLASCHQVDVTPNGQLLCLEPSVATFSPAGLKTQSFGAILGAREGGVLWALGAGSALARWVEPLDGGAFERTPPLGLTLTMKPSWLLPSANDVLAVASSGQMARVTALDAGLLPEAVPPVSAGSLALPWRNGDDVMLLQLQQASV